MKFLVIVDGMAQEYDDVQSADSAFDQAAGKEFESSVLMARVISTATRGLVVSKSYKPRPGGRKPRGPRKKKQAAPEQVAIETA